MDMAAILLNDAIPFEQIGGQLPFDRRPHVISGKIASALSEKTFKNYTMLFRGKGR